MFVCVCVEGPRFAQRATSVVHRSLAATELLAKAGYSQLAWISGGFEASKQQELPVRPALRALLI